MGEARAARVGASHDVSGNLLNVTLPDGRFIEYVTDGRHRRIAKKVNGVIVRRWVYQDQLNPIAELDGWGTVVYLERRTGAPFVFGPFAVVTFPRHGAVLEGLALKIAGEVGVRVDRA